MTQNKILVIDDEPSVIAFLNASLAAEGFEVFQATSGKDGLQKIKILKPHLIILDFGLPDMSGLAVLNTLRQWCKIPVLFLTVRDSENDKISALDAGADDYLTKPFSIGELHARIRVALRHTTPSLDLPFFKNGPLIIDRSAHLAYIAEQEVRLTAREYELLCLLASYAGKVVPHSTILKEIWGPHSLDQYQYLRVYFGQIRKKFEAILKGSGEILQTESGVGYRLLIEIKTEI